MKNIKYQLLFCLIITLCSCNNKLLSRIHRIHKSVDDYVLPINQTDNELKKLETISGAIDNYIAKQEQIVLETKPNKVYTINIPKDLLDKLDEGDLWEIEMYYLGELSSSKQKVLFENATYGYSQYSPHGSQKLLIYNNENQLLGYYGMYTKEIPEIVSGDSIRFNSDSDCNKTTTLSLKDSIPSEIFVRCTEREGVYSGDIYSFNKIEHK